MGSSIGLDRPLPYILNDVRNGLDPTGRVLTNWNITAGLQPCSYGGPAGRMATGVAWTGLACSDFNVSMPGCTLSLSGRTLNGSVPTQARACSSRELPHLS